MIENLITFYLDYKNSHLSINNYAAKHEISCSECLILLSAGKKLNERPIENIAIPTQSKIGQEKIL